MSLAKESKSFPIGRNAKTGRLTTVEKARDKPAIHTVERMPKPGRGDTKREMMHWEDGPDASTSG
jgi:hypothetical protein